MSGEQEDDLVDKACLENCYTLVAVAAILSGLSGGRQQCSLREAGQYSTRKQGRTLLEGRYYKLASIVCHTVIQSPLSSVLVLLL